MGRQRLFALDPVAAGLSEAGLPPETLTEWFLRFLRDAFALDAAGVYVPFRQVAAGTLATMLAERGRPSILVAINHGDTLLAGTWSRSLLWKLPLTYLVPFLVATWGALTSSRPLNPSRRGE